MGYRCLAGKVAHTTAEARAIAAEFAAAGTPRVVVKAQVKAGGRGKAGGVKLATGPDEAAAEAAAILGMDIKGHTVHKVLVEEASDIAAEYYFSYLLDRANRTFLSICSAQGGMEIEEVARSRPDAVARVPVSPLTGVDRAKAMEIVTAGGLPPEACEGAAGLAEKLWAMFADEDATLAEINPMILTRDGRVVALDGKVTLDDNAAHGRTMNGSPIPRPRIRLRRGPRRDVSTMSSSTARWASSATAPAWSCPHSTWSHTRVSSSAAFARRTFSISVAAPPLR